MKRTGWIACAFALAVTCFAAPTLAQDAAADAEAAEDDLEEAEHIRPPTRDARDGTPLIANKLFPMNFRFEGSLLYDMTYGNKYVEHYGGQLNLTFHIFDWLAVEAFGGWFVPGQTNIAAKVYDAGRSKSLLADDPALCATPNCEPELPDLWMTTWFAGGHVQWAPIYGKMSFVSELDLSFQLYGNLGGGVEGVTKKLRDGTYENGEIGGSDARRFYGLGTGIRPVLSYGAGLRIIPWKHFAIRLELRNTHGFNDNVDEKNAQGLDACDNGYTLQVGQELVCNPDINTNAQVQLGVSFLL
jgi:outer membrane beta-barrel protein